ncbi:LPS export ABC transporter periplasmic protein LptC [Curvivirga sp.]|uniref:LPS export ABC transporter periplasmic protein LptC n=1 Tax=Curvivirga sp. TaxID=2856848 RepID=UPI003B59B6B9
MSDISNMDKRQRDNTPPPSYSPNLKRGASIRLSQKSTRLNPYYGHFVSFMKVILPTIALAMVAGIILWPLLQQTEDFNVFNDDPDIDSTKLQVFDASYGGYGDEGSPYTITADRAIQNDPDKPIIDLEEPKGDILWSDDAWYAVTAPKGRMHQDTNMLELWGGVNAFQDQGLEFRSERMSVDLRNRSGFTDAPVEGVGQDIYIEAEGLHIHNGGERIDLIGKSKIIFTGAGKNTPNEKN